MICILTVFLVPLAIIIVGVSDKSQNKYNLHLNWLFQAHRMWVLAVFALFMVGLAWINFFSWPIQPTLGLLSPFTLTSSVNTDYIDNELLAQLVGNEESGKDYYLIDSSVTQTTLAELDQFFKDVDLIRLNDSYNLETKLNKLEAKGISRKLTEILMSLSDNGLLELKIKTGDQLVMLMSTPIYSQRLLKLKKNYKMSSKPEFNLAASFIKVNVIERQDDNKISKFLNDQAKRTIEPGDNILAFGKKVTQAALDRFNARGIVDQVQQDRIYSFWAYVFLLILFCGLFHYYVCKYNLEIYANTSRLSLMLALAFLMSTFVFLIVRIPMPYSFLAITGPMVAFGILAAVEFDRILVIYLGIALSLLCSLMNWFGFDLTAYLLIASIIPPIFLDEASSTGRKINMVIIIALINVLMLLVVVMDSPVEFNWIAVLIGVSGGTLGGIFALGIMPVLDLLLNNLSFSRMAELLDTRHPLLQKLLIEAPGTYNHSMIMGQMAEEAAIAVGANPMLCKLGCYYHDIGKISHPNYFGENLVMGEDNPHDGLSPVQSMRIIKSHMLDGIRIAKKHKLPNQVIDFIEQHHGNTLVKYFFVKAMAKAESIDEQPSVVEFSYSGRRPQSLEIGIVSLADVCEASVRSRGVLHSESASIELIRSVVHEMIRDRLEAGELDESDITIGQLALIERAFTQVLNSAIHKRVRYPGLLDKSPYYSGDSPNIDSEPVYKDLENQDEN